MQKFTIFLAESELYMFLAFFWGIYLSCSSKFEISTFFCLKIFISDFRHLEACSGKNTLHRGLFGVSMDYQRSKYLFGNKFWILGGLLVTLESLKSVRALSAPTQVITSFQSSGGIGLSIITFKFSLTETNV